MANKLRSILDWLPQDNELVPFYDGITRFLNEYLPNGEHDVEEDKFSAKIIADPLLGYIHLQPWEVAIVDTYLFQRLRKIRQLGLAYLVFPSLGYSRFEHSLGVLGHLNLMLSKIVENNLRKDPKDHILTIVKEYEVPLRLAALLHDMGHCLFSHVSERVIETLEGDDVYPSSKTIQEIFTNHFGIEKKIPFAEIYTVSIIGNEKFQKFFSSLEITQKSKLNSLLEQVARFILGLPDKSDPATIFLAQLISSGFDADKIDYMAREAHYSGIKVEIDLDRMLSTLQVSDLVSTT